MRGRAAARGPSILFATCLPLVFVLGLAIGQAPGLTGLGAVALILAGIFSLLCIRHQWVAYAVGLATLVYVPVYAFPAFRIAFQPGVMALLGLGIAIIVQRRSVSPLMTRLDGLFPLLLLATLLSAVAGVRSSSLTIETALLWVGPYLATRTLVRSGPAFRLWTTLVVVVLLPLIPLTTFEYLTGRNIFVGLQLNPDLATVWAPLIARGDTLRPEASLGHPIALAIVLAAGAVLSTATALRANTRRRSLWFAFAGLFALTMLLTLSRTGVVFLGVGLAVLAVSSGDATTKRRIIAVAVTVLIGTLAYVQTGPSAPSTSSSSPVLSLFSGRSQQETAGFRQRLLERAFEADAFKPFGSQVSAFSSFTDAGRVTVDNEFLVFADRYGWFGIAVFLCVLAAGLTSAARDRRNEERAISAALMLGALAAFCFVAFITQVEPLFFAFFGAFVGVRSVGSEAEAAKPSTVHSRLIPPPAHASRTTKEPLRAR